MASRCLPATGTWLSRAESVRTHTRAHTHTHTHTHTHAYTRIYSACLSLTPQAIHGHDATPGPEWASHRLRHPQPSASCPSALVWTCRPTIWRPVGTWLHRIPKRCPARKPNGPGSHAFRRATCRGVLLSITWHHTCHQCALVSHRIQGTHCHMSAVIRCRHDSAARSPSTCCASLPQLMLVYSFRYFKVASMEHGETTIWSSLGEYMIHLLPS